MKERTKAYTAGLFDAEGCLSISKAVKEDGLGQYHLTCKISNKNRKIMKYLISFFGGYFRKEPNNDGWIYHWKLSHYKHMNRFLTLIYPYLQIKRKEADVAFDFIRLFGNFCPEKREELYLKMGSLKNRSVETKTQGFSGKPNLINAYYAGLVDGEGTISIQQFFPNGRSEPAYYGTIRVQNTFKPIVDLMPSLYGGRLSLIQKPRPEWRPQREWRLNRRKDLERFLLKILPYLIIKREQAKLLLNFVRLSDGPATEERKKMFEQMQKLNHPENMI